MEVYKTCTNREIEEALRGLEKALEVAKCGFSQRNITIAALSLSIGLGFTQVPEIFAIFPQMVQNVFAENCVAVVFLVAVILNLVLPENMEAIEK